MTDKRPGRQEKELLEQLKKGLSWAAKSDPEKLAACSREKVASWDHCTLYHYASNAGGESDKPAVLIVYALVNRPYILDLRTGNSTIEKLLQEGVDVYLLDWGYPEAPDRQLNLNRYINTYLDTAVMAVNQHRGASAVSLMGICQGGVLALIYAALHPSKVDRLITVVTPVDFHTGDNVLSHWVRPVDVDLLVDSLGNIPGYMLTSMFQSLQPGKLLLTKYLDFIRALDAKGSLQQKDSTAMFLAMERWISDSPDLAGEAFREFVKGCFQKNLLVQGRFEVGGHKVDLRALPMPVLNIFASQDHLVPPSASKALAALIPEQLYQEMEVATGHIGMFVSGKALRSVPARIARWLKDDE